jgi:acyl-CoA reductase-like NAD-dependent aldehyde dehydrogenase
MTTVNAVPGATRTFDSLNPATGEVVATFPEHTADDVHAAVSRARAAAAWWRELGPDGRRKRLLAFKSELIRRSEELATLIHVENGKPFDDARIEIAMVTDHLDWAARHAGRVMRRRRVPSTLFLANHRAQLEYQPAGVVGVIGPWNYPLHTPMGSVGYALAAGNAVVYKPSEYTPAVGRWVVDTFRGVVPEEPVLQLVTGYGATGEALCRSGVDVLAFTGSARTARKVMAACVPTLTKVVLECGGKDAMIVDVDANLEQAAAAAVWGGCANAGQTCAGVERIYVIESVFEEFLRLVVEEARRVRVGPDGDVGPITMPGQLDVIRAHISEALERGATAVLGGVDAVKPPYVEPVVLVDVPEDARVMREETFGPVLPVTAVRDLDEAVLRANDSSYGLGSTVYGRRNASAIADRLRAGMVSINSMLTYAAIPSLPFGGRGESGSGRLHGEDGLKEFTVPKAISRRWLPVPEPLEFATFGRHPQLLVTIDRIRRLVYGRR